MLQNFSSMQQSAATQVQLRSQLERKLCFSFSLCHLSPETSLEDECKHSMMETNQGDQEVLELFFISEICSPASRWMVVVLMQGERRLRFLIPGPEGRIETKPESFHGIRSVCVLVLTQDVSLDLENMHDDDLSSIITRSHIRHPAA